MYIFKFFKWIVARLTHGCQCDNSLQCVSSRPSTFAFPLWWQPWGSWLLLVYKIYTRLLWTIVTQLYPLTCTRQISVAFTPLFPAPAWDQRWETKFTENQQQSLFHAPVPGPGGSRFTLALAWKPALMLELSVAALTCSWKKYCEVFGSLGSSCKDRQGCSA